MSQYSSTHLVTGLGQLSSKYALLPQSPSLPLKLSLIMLNFLYASWVPFEIWNMHFPKIAVVWEDDNIVSNITNTSKWNLEDKQNTCLVLFLLEWTNEQKFDCSKPSSHSKRCYLFLLNQYLWQYWFYFMRYSAMISPCGDIYPKSDCCISSNLLFITEQVWKCIVYVSASYHCSWHIIINK